MDPLSRFSSISKQKHGDIPAIAMFVKGILATPQSYPPQE